MPIVRRFYFETVVARGAINARGADVDSLLIRFGQDWLIFRHKNLVIRIGSLIPGTADFQIMVTCSMLPADARDAEAFQPGLRRAGCSRARTCAAAAGRAQS
jgi:hypothetical protein